MLKKFYFFILGLKSRYRSLQFGILYWHSQKLKLPERFFLNYKFKPIRFNQNSNDLFLTEFFSICISDSYNIRSLRNRDIHSILDIGANQGLFVLIARKVFPKASIHAYEPNKNLNRYVKYNCEKLKAEYYEQAVMSRDCKVKLALSDSDLATQALTDAEGDVDGISFKKGIERQGGNIDLVKMDCEGGEWELLDCTDDWKHVRFLTMEYHLWHANGHSLEELKKKIEQICFKIVKLRPINEYCGLLFAQNMNSVQ